MPAPAALDHLCRALGLSRFERDVLLICAGVELDASFAELWSGDGNGHQRPPTFGLAMALLPEPEWNALAPSSPLRYFRLLDLGPGERLTTSPLRIDENILHYIAGVSVLDERLQNVLEPVPIANSILPTSHRAHVDAIVKLLARPADVSPVVALIGPEGSGRRAVAAAVCALGGLTLSALSVRALTGGQEDLIVARLLTREALLRGMALLLPCDRLESADAVRREWIAKLIDRVQGPVFVVSRERERFGVRPVVPFPIQKPLPSEQRALWEMGMGERRMGEIEPAPRPEREDAAPAWDFDALVAQFDLGAEAISSVCRSVRAGRADSLGPEDARALWTACRAEARPQLDALADRVDAVAEWDDLVLPDLQKERMREIVVQVRQRFRVYQEWGFASVGGRGLGITALFSGTSGTGKTMAAEVLARELGLDLYRIDLSRVVDKYIGETEKNLRRIFDAADAGAAILLFDEADALFGKRSEVKDSHDRFANIEVSYLLQRMEAFRGLAILTTNLKSSLDTAFQRRIRFIVEFPLPGAVERAAIWSRVFPRETPTEGLDYEQLARMHLAGGSIRSIAVQAAFLAAGDGIPVRMTHVMRATRAEYEKIGRMLTSMETPATVHG